MRATVFGWMVAALAISPALGVPTQPSGSGAAAEGAMFRRNQQALASWLEQSKSPRDWALAGQIDGYSGAPSPIAKQHSGALLRKAAAAATDDRLVQWLWVEETPERSGCRHSADCPGRAGTLAMLDPDNGAAWLPVIDEAWSRHDDAAPDRALERMAGAPRYDDGDASLFRAWEAALRRYPPAQPSYRAHDNVSVGFAGMSLASVEWTESGPPRAVDNTPEGAALTLVQQGHWPQHPWLARACDKAARPHVAPARWTRCGLIGRALLEQSHFVLERTEGALVLRVSGQSTQRDIATARALRWQLERFGRLPFDTHTAALQQYLVAFDASNSEVDAMHAALLHAGIPLDPPESWQLVRNGKVINPLGEWHPSKQVR